MGHFLKKILTNSVTNTYLTHVSILYINKNYLFSFCPFDTLYFLNPHYIYVLFNLSLLRFQQFNAFIQHAIVNGPRKNENIYIWKCFRSFFVLVVSNITDFMQPSPHFLQCRSQWLHFFDIYLMYFFCLIHVLY